MLASFLAAMGAFSRFVGSWKAPANKSPWDRGGGGSRHKGESIMQMMARLQVKR